MVMLDTLIATNCMSLTSTLPVDVEQRRPTVVESLKVATPRSATV